LVSWLGTGKVVLAADQSISVLGLEPAAGAPDLVATTVTEALRQKVTSTGGYRLVPGRDLVEVKLVFSCPDEAPPCMTQAAQSIGAAKVIFGNVQPMGTDAYLVTLKLLDAERGVVETWISEQITKAQTEPAALRGPVQKWFATLTGQSLPGSLKVTGGVIGAGVWLDGAQAGLLGADGLTITGIAAGPHHLSATKAGYEKFERNFTMASGAAEKLGIQLKAVEVPVPAAPPPAEPGVSPLTSGPTEPMPPPPEAANGGFRVAAWATVAVGAALLGLGAYSSWVVGDVNSNLDQYRRYPCASNPSLIACSADGKTQKGTLSSDPKDPVNVYIKSQQDRGDTWSAVQWIGYGGGAVLLATSAVFFYHGYASKPSDSTARGSSTSLVVMPTFAPGSAGATMYLRF